MALAPDVEPTRRTRLSTRAAGPRGAETSCLLFPARASVTSTSTGKVMKVLSHRQGCFVCMYVPAILLPSEERDKASLASLKLRPVSKATATEGEEKDAGERTQACEADGAPEDSAAPAQSPGSRERMSWQSKRSRLDPSSGPCPKDSRPSHRDNETPRPHRRTQAVQSSFIGSATGGCIPASPRG